MLIAYIDESGDGGFNNSPSTHFALGIIIVPSENWLEALNDIIAYRRYLRATYGIPHTAELKAQHLRRGNQQLGRLSTRDRMAIYHASMEFLASKRWAKVFAVVIDKQAITKRGEKHVVLTKAWEYTVQRLQKWTGSQGTELMVVHDDGTNALIKRTLRKMRRYHRAGSHYEPGRTLRADADLIIEDPTPRISNDSYFIQLADLVAYAAIRRISPTSRFNDGPWNLIGPSRLKEVSGLVHGPYGIV